jgi:hypothetical protein
MWTLVSIPMAKATAELALESAGLAAMVLRSVTKSTVVNRDCEATSDDGVRR